MRRIPKLIVCVAFMAGAQALAQQTPAPNPAPSPTPSEAVDSPEYYRRVEEERRIKENADEIAFAKMIFGDATEGQAHRVCYVRVYDAAHLKAHPIQKVTDIRIIVSARPLTAAEKKGSDEAPAEDTLWRWRYAVHAVLRNGSVRNRATTTPCTPGVDEKGTLHMRCNAACDTGDEIRLKDDGRAITFGIAGEDLADKTYDPHYDPKNPNPKPVDDNYFRLERAPMAECAFSP